jgi:hypothetical protein
MNPQDDDSNKDSQGGDSNASANAMPSGSGSAVQPSRPGDHFTESQSLVDELDVRDLRDPLRDSRGKVFSAAGRNAPVAEFTDEFLVLHPPQLPFQDADEGPAEEIVLMMDASGVLVDQWGERKKIPGAKFHGKAIFFYWEQKPGTLKHYAVFFDEQNNHHFLSVDGERITVDVIYKLRNMTHDGELTRFKELTQE